MEIPEIKQRLTLANVLHHYGLKPDKNMRLNCPFHEDKNPSMQVYYKTHTAYCFSSNCKTHGKSLDVIDFIMYKENINKHEAIKKAESMLNGNVPEHNPKANESRTAFLTRMYIYFKNAVHNSKPAKDYINQRCLDPTALEIGYNTAQFHHGARKDETLIANCVKYGILSPWGTNNRDGGQAYKPFAKYCIVFALKNHKGEITGLYFRSTENNTDQRHFYLKNREGLYPGYPNPDAKKLIITESIIDAATLLQITEFTKEYEILALYGTNGLTEEHRKAIAALDKLEEVILFLNGDEAGRTAVLKHTDTIATLRPGIKITNVEPPENEDVNSLLQGHEPGIFTELINSRTSINTSSPTTEIFLSNEKTSIEKKKESSETLILPEQTPPTETIKTEQPQPKLNGHLDTSNPYNLIYTGISATYYVKGGLHGNLASMKISMQIINRETRFDHRAKADLYEYKPVESLIKSASGQLNIPAEEIKKDLSRLTHLLEQHRSKTLTEKSSSHRRKPEKQIPQATINQCLDILKSANPIKRINELIGRSGVTGEENNRIFLFGIASSYKMPDTLHALIQGSSGSGKTMLLKTIYDLMPDEDTTKFTRVTDSSFYNYPEHYFVNRLVCFEDIDGLKEDALYAVRELISNEILVSSTSIKTESGQITAAEKTVRGPIASISCTTKGEIYEDNMSRVFLIAVDESTEQTRRIIQYQQQKASGAINRKEEKQVKELLQNCIRLLKPYEVVNPYAGKIQLPEEAHKIRRLNDLYLSFVRQITLLNQYKRHKDNQGRLITEPEDLQTANEIMFDSIILKIDELDGSLRSFYEKLKHYVLQNGKEYTFSQREIRQTFKISKTGCQNHINTLSELEYIYKTYIGKHNTYSYRINHWDSLEALRQRIRTYLEVQLKTISDQN